MKSSSRIAFNTAVTYLRSLLGVGLALFSSRWILQALGTTDFGLFQIVGSLIVFLTFFNSVMASSAARHFAFAIGKGDAEDVNRWFNTSLNIHLLLPAILILIGWPIAEYAIRNWLTIPPERVEACVIVFRVSLIGAFVNMASVPFVAMFTAKQRIAEVSMWGMLQTLMVFALAWSLTQVTLDRLLVYAAGIVGTHVFIHSLKIARAFSLFPECRLHLFSGFQARRLLALCNFAGWSMIGISGSILRDQGSSVLLNIYFGPTVNAAYGIANQISNQTNMLSAALMNAISPEITAREGRGQRDSMITLSEQTSKLGTLLALFFSIPLLMETEYILKLWLVTPPVHAAVLCKFILITFIVDKMTAGYMFAVNAYGKIARYQATLGTLLLLTLPLAWIFLSLGMSPAAVGLAFVVMQLLCTIGRALWVKRLFNVPVRNWLHTVVIPCGSTALITTLMAVPFVLLLEPSFLRFILVGLTCATSMFAFGWMLCFSRSEKRFVQDSLNRILHLLLLKKRGA